MYANKVNSTKSLAESLLVNAVWGYQKSLLKCTKTSHKHSSMLIQFNYEKCNRVVTNLYLYCFTE